MKKIVVFLVIVVALPRADAQAPVRRFPQPINHPSMNVFAPFVSMDGQTVLFVSDYAEDNALTVYYSEKENVDWITPVVMPKYVNNALNYLYGYTLNADGTVIYLSTIRYGGVGGYDIVMGNFHGAAHVELLNPGTPINSKSNDASPTLTPDGKTMYFMRCEKMDRTKAENCKLYVISKNGVGQWGEAAELPANINTGNCQLPRIMADGETLIFSSNTMPGAKGMDLYVAHRNGVNWSDPEPLTFVNTDGDDRFVSVTAISRYLIRDSPGERKNEIVEYLFPDNLRPKGVQRVDGKITNAQGQPAPAYLSVTDLETKRRTFTGRPEPDGSFILYLTEGSRYELAADPERGEYTFFTKRYDLTSDRPLNPDHLLVVLRPVVAGDELALGQTDFVPHTSKLDPGSAMELSRLSRIIKSAPDLAFEIQVLLEGYAEDTVQRDPDLTEIVYDSTYQLVEHPDTVRNYARMDSLLHWANDSLARDSMALSVGDVDSLYMQMITDTVLVVKIRYHNDRTMAEAEAIADELVRLGVDRGKLQLFANAWPEAIPEKRRTLVKVVVRKR